MVLFTVIRIEGSCDDVAEGWPGFSMVESIAADMVMPVIGEGRTVTVSGTSCLWEQETRIRLRKRSAWVLLDIGLGRIGQAGGSSPTRDDRRKNIISIDQLRQLPSMQRR